MAGNVIDPPTFADAELQKTDVNSGSGTTVPEKEANVEPEWFRDGDAWVKIFLEPDGAERAGDVAPGKFKQHDHVYSVPGTNEFPIERWSSEECKDGFHITRRRDVWCHLDLHNYKSAYIAEVVSMGDEFYDSPHQLKRKVRVVTFGPAVPLADVLGKHPNDFEGGQLLKWSAANNHLELLKLFISKKQKLYFYIWAFEIALEKGKDQIADFLFEQIENKGARHDMLCAAICYGRVDFVERLMENTPFDASWFETACESGQFKIFQLLCAKYGDPKCSDIIESALLGGNDSILDYIKSRGVDMTDLGMLFYACAHYASNLSTVRYLVSEGADVKHPLVAYIAKMYAREEVSEYLLSQIDDKSEVPRCEKLTGKILESHADFRKRLAAGGFD
jgi:hypothetical protein